jgi:LAO/AO transport system kinase
VGQSEAIVRDMVDFFLLLVLTGAGDELQGMKKGIMELVDAIVVNKADGENAAKARKTAEEYKQILHFLQPATESWETKAFTCSALHDIGIDQTWETINEFLETTIDSGEFDKRRNEQKKTWLYTSVKSQLEMMFFQNNEVKKQLPVMEEEIRGDRISVSAAVDQLMEIYKKGQ